jgi:ubiquitin carboxyl-terminal hydrolase 36/42
MKNIAHHIKIGQQEDAHEFLLYFLDAMETSAVKYVQGFKKKFTKVKTDDSLIHKIFAGILTSSVTCNKCKKSSNKTDKFIDISLVR